MQLLEDDASAPGVTHSHLPSLSSSAATWSVSPSSPVLSCGWAQLPAELLLLL